MVKIQGTNIETGFTFDVFPRRSGASRVITIPGELFKANQIPEGVKLTVTIKLPKKVEQGQE